MAGFDKWFADGRAASASVCVAMNAETTTKL